MPLDFVVTKLEVCMSPDVRFCTKMFNICPEEGESIDFWTLLEGGEFRKNSCSLYLEQRYKRFFYTMILFLNFL